MQSKSIPQTYPAPSDPARARPASMAWLALALLMLPTDALAQQRTIYGGDGKVIGRESTGTNGASTLYGADGRVLSRTTSSSSGTTTVYGADGRRTGTVTAQQKREGR